MVRRCLHSDPPFYPLAQLLICLELLNAIVKGMLSNHKGGGGPQRIPAFRRVKAPATS